MSCSGGVDSTALFRVFLEIFKEKKIFSLEVFHFNYGLRGEDSDGDESFCRALAEDNHLTFTCHRATPDQHEARGDSGIQDWARSLRRTSLEQLAANGKIVVLAHHADDVIETILMRMMRGTSLRSMRGMAELDGIWWRPWLPIAKAEILAAAQEIDMLFREDVTNNQLDYTRNVLRHNVLPPLLKTWPNGGRKLRDLAEDAYTVSTFALETAKSICQFTTGQPDGSGASCSRTKLAQLPEAVAFQVISDLIRAATNGPVRQISRANLAKILDAARDQHSDLHQKQELEQRQTGTRRFTLEVAKGIFVECRGSTVRSFPG